MHQEKTWRSKSVFAERISSSKGSRKSSTSSFCERRSFMSGFQPSLILEFATAHGWRSRKIMSISGKLARIQPSIRFARMSLIKRRCETNLLWKRSAQRLLSAPESMARAGCRNSSRRSAGQEDGVSIVTVEVHIEPAEHTGSQPPRPLPRVLLRHGSGLPTEGAPDSTPERKEELTVAGAQAQSQESSQEDHQE